MYAPSLAHSCQFIVSPDTGKVGMGMDGMMSSSKSSKGNDGDEADMMGMGIGKRQLGRASAVRDR